jgi:hypothetical protein
MQFIAGVCYTALKISILNRNISKINTIRFLHMEMAAYFL